MKELYDEVAALKRRVEKLEANDLLNGDETVKVTFSRREAKDLYHFMKIYTSGEYAPKIKIGQALGVIP